MASTLTHERLLQIVHYDPETGVFSWRVVRPKCRAGDRIGTLRDDGYLQAGILGKSYLLHRLAWFYMTGRWPALIDHRNRKKADDRWRNLREATNGQNLTNSDLIRSNSGFRGVFALPPRKGGEPRYKAHISLQDRSTHLGIFDTPEEAHAAYVRAAQAHHGEFAEHLS